MTPELIAILAVGATIVGFVVNAQRAARKDIGDLRSEVNGKIDGIRTEIGNLRERMAKLEGLLEGLREAISGRKDAA